MRPPLPRGIPLLPFRRRTATGSPPPTSPETRRPTRRQRGFSGSTRRARTSPPGPARTSDPASKRIPGGCCPSHAKPANSQADRPVDRRDGEARAVQVEDVQATVLEDDLESRLAALVAKLHEDADAAGAERRRAERPDPLDLSPSCDVPRPDDVHERLRPRLGDPVHEDRSDRPRVAASHRGHDLLGGADLLPEVTASRAGERGAGLRPLAGDEEAAALVTFDHDEVAVIHGVTTDAGRAPLRERPRHPEASGTAAPRRRGAPRRST